MKSPLNILAFLLTFALIQQSWARPIITSDQAIVSLAERLIRDTSLGQIALIPSEIVNENNGLFLIFHAVQVYSFDGARDEQGEEPQWGKYNCQGLIYFNMNTGYVDRSRMKNCIDITTP
jgi:hypothetical protein